MPRAASAAMQAYLAGRPTGYYQADLFTFTLIDGTVLRYSGTLGDLTDGVNTWSGSPTSTPAVTVNVPKNSPKNSRGGRWSLKNTIDVSELELSLLSNGLDYPAGNIKAFIHNGLFAGATLLLQRAIMPTFGDLSLGLVDIWGGVAGPISLNSRGATITFKGRNVMMQQYMPRNRYQFGCVHALYDAGCTLSKATFTFSATVSAATATSILWASDPTSGAYARLALGQMIITSGAGDGQRRSIPSADAAGIALNSPLFVLPAPGDTFDVTFGCDKSEANCVLFSNTAHYRGFRFIPPATAAI